MTKSIKIQMIPNNKQNSRLFQYAGSSRFAYNWALDKIKEYYEANKKFISESELRKSFTIFKKQEENRWLYSVSNDALKQSIRDAYDAYKKAIKKKAGFPKHKNRKKNKASFYQDVFKIKFESNRMKLEGLAGSARKNRCRFNYVKLAEKDRIPTDTKIANPRITFDGLHWWISIAIETTESKHIPKNDGIGIDLGLKNLITCSDGNVYSNINKSKQVKKIEKQKRRLQRGISRKYELNKKGGSYCKTHNVIKAEKKLLKITQKLMNIRHSHILQAIKEIVSRDPRFICLENLNVSGMMKNRHLSKAIADANFYKIRTTLEYKAKRNNIELFLAERFFPSSKICSNCGVVKQDLKLSDRVYKCSCGFEIDRDLNASINLKNYGAQQYQALLNA